MQQTKITLVDRTLNRVGAVTKKQAAMILEGRPPAAVFGKKFLERHPSLEEISVNVERAETARMAAPQARMPSSVFSKREYLAKTLLGVALGVGFMGVIVAAHYGAGLWGGFALGAVVGLAMVASEIIPVWDEVKQKTRLFERAPAELSGIVKKARKLLATEKS